MATLHNMAVNMPLTYITATFDTVTTPDSLVHLFDEYFQYFTHKGHPEPQDAEQVRPILDLINTTALPSASTGDILQGGSENITALGSIAGLPPVATLAARYKYTQALSSDRGLSDAIPEPLAGEMLTNEAVAESLKVTERQLEEEYDRNAGGGILSVVTPKGRRYPAKQFNAEGQIILHVAELMRWAPDEVAGSNSWVKLFTPHVALGYVSPVEYVKLGRGHQQALSFAYSQCKGWVDDTAHMNAYMSGNFEDSPYWDEYAGAVEGWVAEDGLM